MSVRVSCEECGAPVTVTPGNRPPRYCGALCRRAAKLRRKGVTCTICGGGATRRARGQVIAFCEKDGNLIWRTCMGKWPGRSAEEILDVRPGAGPMVAYRCPMCLRWHRTSQVGESIPDRLADQKLIGERLRNVGFKFRDRLWIPWSTQPSEVVRRD